MKALMSALWLVSSLAAGTALAQPAPPNEAGVTMGHWHLNSRDVEANKKIFVALGGVAAKPGDFDIVKFPGVVVFLHLRPGVAPSSGGTDGTVINHVGFLVPNVQEAVARWKAAGVAVTPGSNERTDQAWVIDAIKAHQGIAPERLHTTPALKALQLEAASSMAYGYYDVERVQANTLAEFPWACALVGRQNTILENLLRAEGVAMPRQITEYGSVTFLKTLVSGSDHLAMLPIHAIKPDIVDGRLKPLSITASQLYRNIAVYFRESSSLDEASRDLVTNVEAVGTDVCREQPYGIPKEASLQI